MDFLILLKSKNKIINAIIILCAVLISYNIYNAQTKSLVLLKGLKEAEAKKNNILTEIIILEKKINIYKTFVNSKDISTIINKLSNLANDSGIIINSIKPIDKQDFPVYVRYPFSLLVTARNYEDAGRFVSALENSPDVYVIESANIRPKAKEADPEPENVVLTLLINTVLFK